MRSKLLISLLFVIFMAGSGFAQLAQNSWSFAFGGLYPRYISSGVMPGDANYGAYLSFQRNFSEHVGLRAFWNYGRLQGKSGGLTQNSDMMGGSLDMLFYLAPCEPVSPYLLAGAGGFFYKVSNPVSTELKGKFMQDVQLSLGLGAEWYLTEDWKLQSEFDYNTPLTSRLDGMITGNNNGLLGGPYDTYFILKVGFLYYFSKGEPSKLCDLYNGITVQNAPEVDYDRIESIIRKYQEKPVTDTVKINYERIEEIVKRNRQLTAAASKSNWQLVGVTFDLGSAEFKTESYPILYNAAQILVQNPDLKVEIQGYTDDVGSDTYNLNLSLKRANAVKDYLVSHGVAEKRLTAVGFGSQNPVGNNRSAKGRVLNRRIEFKILN